MKKLGILLTMTAVSMIGCGQESEPGGPGAAARTGANGSANGDRKAADDKRTFTVTVPGTTVDVDRGEEEEVTISLDRGDEFNETVTLTIEAPAGLNVAQRTVEMAAGQDEVKVRIRADAAARLGEHSVMVKATPKTGKAVDQSFKIEVNEADDADRPADPDRPAPADPVTPAPRPANP